MNEIYGMLNTALGNERVYYTVVETDGQILRVAGKSDPNKPQAWFDLRPMSDDVNICSNIIKSVEAKLNLTIAKPEKLTLTNWHNSGMVAAYGIFQFENSRFLVTDAFGGHIFSYFLNHLEPDQRPALRPKDIISFLRNVTKTLLLWKKAHGYISSQTVLLEYSHDMLHAGLICFLEKFPENLLQEFANFFRPNLYNRLLNNRELIPDDQHSIALITLQLLAGKMGIGDPLASDELLEKFHPLIQDPNMARFYQAKLRPIIQQLFDGAITTEKLESLCQELENSLDQAKRLSEYIQRYASFTQNSVPQFFRNTYSFSFFCTYCGSEFYTATLDNTEPCPVCHRRTEIPPTSPGKICRNCHKIFSLDLSVCPECQGQSQEKPITAPEPESMLVETVAYTGIDASEETRLKEIFLAEPAVTSSTSNTKTEVAEEPSKAGPPNRLGRGRAVPAKIIPIPDHLPVFSEITCKYEDGDVTVIIKDAEPGDWKIQITRDEAGKQLLEQIEFHQRQKKDLSQIVPMALEELEDAKDVFVLVHQNKLLLECRKLSLEDH